MAESAIDTSLAARLGWKVFGTIFGVLAGAYIIFACIAVVLIMCLLVISPITVMMGVAEPLEVIISKCELVVSVVLVYVAFLYSL